MRPAAPPDLQGRQPAGIRFALSVALVTPSRSPAGKSCRVQIGRGFKGPVGRGRTNMAGWGRVRLSPARPLWVTGGAHLYSGQRRIQCKRAFSRAWRGGVRFADLRQTRWQRAVCGFGRPPRRAPSPGNTGVFRAHPTTPSVSIRPPVPIRADHRFRFRPTTLEGEQRWEIKAQEGSFPGAHHSLDATIFNERHRRCGISPSGNWYLGLP